MGGENRRLQGGRNERLAGRFLEEQGYQILQYNFRCRYAEIDIVAQDGAYLVFCEVKSRKSAGAEAALAAVDLRKQRRICQAALYYLSSRHLGEVPCRFDVVGIAEGRFVLRKNAFDYQGGS